MQRKENHTLKTELRHFTGSEQVYSNPLFRNFVYTEGVKYLAEQGECYWLIDYIFSNQILVELKEQRFQTWKIEVAENDSAVFIVEDGDNNQLTQLEIEFTDFPFNEFTLWVVDKTLLLPSEY